MLTLAICLALSPMTPPNLSLSYTKATAVSDSTLLNIPRTGRRGMRGLVVSDDGTAIFGCDGTAIRMSSDTDSAIGMPLYLLKSKLDGPAMTSNQAGWLEMNGKANKDSWIEIKLSDLLCAKDHETIVGLHPIVKADSRVSAISQMSMGNVDPATNKLLLAGKDAEFPTNAIADRASDGFFVEFGKVDGDYVKTTDMRSTVTPGSAMAQFPPGFAPILYDSQRDMIVCFTYSESGFPNDLRVRHVKSDAQEKLPRMEGAIEGAAILPNGNILASYVLPYDEEAEPGKTGLFEYAAPYSTARYVGPYKLAGCSRDGHWVLISHLDLRRSWLLQIK